MRIGLCLKLDEAPGKVEGLDYIEPSVGDLLVPDRPEPAFMERLALLQRMPAPVEAVNCLFPGHLTTTGPEVDDDAVDTFFATLAVRAVEAGVQRVVFGSGGSRRVPEGFSDSTARDQLVNLLRRCGAVAAKLGILLVFEPLNTAECNIGVSVDEAADLVRLARSEGVGLLVDTYHMARNGEGPDAIDRAGDLIAHVHCAERDGRGPLGTVGEDQRPYFAALKRAGYDQRVSIEAKFTDLPAQAPAAVAELRGQIDEA